MTYDERKRDFSHFGRPFQESLVHNILHDRPFADQIGEVLDFNFFDVKYLRFLTKEIYDYKRQYDFYPSEDVLSTILNNHYPINKAEPPAINVQIHKFFDKIRNKEPHKNEETFVKENALDFCKKQVLKKAILKADDLIETHSFNNIEKVIKEALKLGADNDFGYDYHLDVEKRFEADHRQVIPTKHEELNKLIGGGLGRGELGIILGGSGVGKSQLACDFVGFPVSQGYNGVYYTMELRDTVIGQRVDANITGIDVDDLISRKSDVLEIIKNVPGKLIIKEYPPKRATVTTLERHLEKLIMSDIYPDIVIVDYGDLLLGQSPNGEIRHNLGNIFEDLRGMAKVYNVAVWALTQSNRQGSQVAVLTMDYIAEAFNKVFCADVVLGLSKSNLFLSKNRNGPTGDILPILMNTANTNITVFPPTDEDPEELNENYKKRMVKETSKKLLDKFQKLQQEEIK